MTTKTTSTTGNNAGCSPCTPEASKGQMGKSRKYTGTMTTCHGCVHLAEQKDNVGWCTFHWQYRSISLERTCEGAQFFDKEA